MYKDDCRGCQRSLGCEIPLGGITEMEGNWILNHYGGEESFLGWMALQTKEHVMELMEVPWEDLDKLGGNIRRIDEALRDYWRIQFQDDPPTRWHLHIHLITRTERVGKGNPSRVAAWYTPCLVKWHGFPQEYRVWDESTKERINENRVEDLMKYLKMRLEKQSSTIE
jgi:diadenosine tetraphosphate (Ap4A) HIT family hydrolase